MMTCRTYKSFLRLKAKYEKWLIENNAFLAFDHEFPDSFVFHSRE